MGGLKKLPLQLAEKYAKEVCGNDTKGDSATLAYVISLAHLEGYKAAQDQLLSEEAKQEFIKSRNSTPSSWAIWLGRDCE